ncbi:MAG: bifunctional phosphoglucose/phosphomannose isomerase [Candidatus Bathyarchaeia archaeon]
METMLDRLEEIEALDKGGMLRTLTRFPESCRDAMVSAERIPLDALERKRFKAVVIAGVGGSAIGGQLLRDWLLDSCPLPIYVSRGYHLPRFVDEETLVFAVSYSGDTAETLSAYHEALERKSPLVALTSGGEMRRLSEENGVPLLSLPKGLPPRAALPNQFFLMATVLRRLDLAPRARGEFDEAIEVLEALRGDLVPETPAAANPAKQLAMGLKSLVAFVYGPRLFEGRRIGSGRS